MSLAQQIQWGSAFLGACLIVQVLFMGLAAQTMSVARPKLLRFGRSVLVSVFLSVTLAAILVSLTIQVWIWAWVYFSYDLLGDWNSAVYFSLVTFTSLGYGDIVLGPEVRIFAAFGSVTGLLTFGLSTALMVASISTRSYQNPD